MVGYLTDEQVAALLAAPGRSTWTGRRDHALIQLAITTGLRVSELTALTGADLHLGTGPHLLCHGKGRKDRAKPLTRETVGVLRTCTAERPGDPAAPLFPTAPDRP